MIIGEPGYPTRFIQPPYSWECPYCGRPATITDADHELRAEHVTRMAPDAGEEVHAGFVIYELTRCPAPSCRQIELTVLYTRAAYIDHKGTHPGLVIYRRRLLPESEARPQPDYIPQQLRDDYYEACRIRDLSPKASATLARRCLQGMIRDFWGVSKRRLIEEIEAIKDKVDPATWRAIDAVRGIGNIGAHMEQDVNVIVEVEPREAQVLIQLIETLFTEWYVHRHEREQRMNELVKLNADKQAARKGPSAAQTEGANAAETAKTDAGAETED